MYCLGYSYFLFFLLLLLLLLLCLCAPLSHFVYLQLLYDVVDGGASIGLISLRSEHMSVDERKRFEEIGIELPALT